MEQQKLSAYIRQGAKKRPQAFNDYIQVNFLDGSCSTCALGAAYEAITGKLPPSDQMETGKVNKTIYSATSVKGTRIDYPENTLSGCKACITDMIATLNDTFKWSREQIADYLESQGY